MPDISMTKKMTELRVLFAHMQDNLSGVETRFHPLWPAYLAAFAEQQFGTEKFKFRFASKEIHYEIESFKPQIVAIGAVSPKFNDAIECARIAKRYGVSTIVGGVHISTLPECLTEGMDVGCIGEGEQSFAELLAHFFEHGVFRGSQLADIKGIVYRKNGELVKTPIRPLIQTFDQIPHPKRSLVGYLRHDYLLTGRGCPYKCSFCSCSRFWRKARYASPSYVLEEIRELTENGAKIIRFEDDSLTTNTRRLQEISNLIVADGLDRRVQFSCWARANEVNAEAVDSLKKMNVRLVWMGLESGCQRTLDYLKGHVTVEQNLRATSLLKDAGIQTNGFFIIGSPSETEEEIMQTYKFIRESQLDFATVNILTPLPGTATWDHWTEKNSIVDGLDWSRLFSIRFDPRFDIIISEEVSPAELYRLYRKFAMLSRSMKRKANFRKLRQLELPRIAHELLISFRLFYKKLTVRHRTL